MHILRQDILPPSGIEFATYLKLTPSCIASSLSPRHEFVSRVLCNLVVARSNLLRIFELREELSTSHEDDPRDRRGQRRGTEAVEGEVLMDRQGDGFINVSKGLSTKGPVAPPKTRTRLYLIKEHKLHGIVTGLENVKTISSIEDKLDRLLVSFKDAKIALLEWSSATYDLSPVSIHTYERAPQLLSLTAPLFRSYLRVDPLSRCAALALPNHAVAILPFYQTQAELLDIMAMDSKDQVPYSPSFILDLALQVHTSLRNVIDFGFLPGFTNPTMAVLSSPTQTWTGRLAEHKDTTRLVIFTLSIDTSSSSASSAQHAYPIISTVEGLPHDAMYLIPCTKTFGGVVVVTSNSLVYVDQASSRQTVLPLNGWASRVSDQPMPPVPSVAPGVSSPFPDPAMQDTAEGGGGNDLNIPLEGSKATFIDDKTLLLVLASGVIYPVEIVADGRTVSRLQLLPAIAQGTIPSTLALLPFSEGGASDKDSGRLFVGSAVGPSTVSKVWWDEEEVSDEIGGDVSMDPGKDDLDYDMDEDDDLYGDSKTSLPTKAVEKEVKTKTRSVLKIELEDSLEDYGPISNVGFGLSQSGDKPVPELVTSTGAGILGGFTLFQRDLPIRTRKKIPAIGGTRGLWSLPIRIPPPGSSSSRKGGSITGGLSAAEMNVVGKEGRDTLILSTDAVPSPGVSRIATKATYKNKDYDKERGGEADITISIVNRLTGTMIGAASFFQRTAILVVLSGAIKVMEPDGTERQTILDLDGKLARPKIRHCSILDPFVLIIREDDSLGLFIGETERGKIRRKDMSPMGEKTSKYIAGCFFSDTSGIFSEQFETSVAGAETTTATLQSVVSNAGAGGMTNGGAAAGSEKKETQWLVLVRPGGVLEVWTLPKLALAFSTGAVPSLENVLVDSHAKPTSSVPLPTDPPVRKPQEFDVEQVSISRIGEGGRERTCLCVFLRSGQLTIYEALPSSVTSPGSTSEDVHMADEHDDQHEPGSGSGHPPNERRSTTLNIKFVKISSIAFDIPLHRGDEGDENTAAGEGSGVLAEHKKVSRQFVPFVVQSRSSVSSATPTTYSGVFFTGDRPSWILGTDHGGVQIFPSGFEVVYSFTSCSIWDERGDFLVYCEEGPKLIEWLPDFTYTLPLPARSIPRGRSYSNVLFDPSTCLVVAASCMKARFGLYDEDGLRVWGRDGPNVADPVTDTSALELISPDSWVTMDGFEFATNEYINDISIVTLETAATETGSKDFIAVGTTVDRGEDLAAKGAAYIFEIVEVVPDEDIAPTRWYKLRLRCRDDAKGPVTAVCGFHGYLVSSMGQKIFVRAFDSDERLVGVAFIDVGIYVTSLRVLKNLLLIGDAVKSIMFVAFQEDPYKLVLLAKDVDHHCVTRADFFFNWEGELAIIAGDEEGIMRVYDYNPQDPDSRDGRFLLLRTEYHGQVEYRTSVMIARRDKDDPSIPQSKLLIGSADGSLSSLTPVDEHSFKRLQLLQGQLTRNIQHVAGLNPKAFRIVKNDHVSKPISKGILDGNLLAHYELLPIPRQNEMTKQIGTERSTVLNDWTSLTGPW